MFTVFLLATKLASTHLLDGCSCEWGLSEKELSFCDGSHRVAHAHAPILQRSSVAICCSSCRPRAEPHAGAHFTYRR